MDTSLLPLAARFALFICLLLVYASSFRGTFVFDDLTTIKENESIRSLWPLSVPLAPGSEGGETFVGRPLVNLSFAINYAIGELDPFGYHLTNLLLHASSSLILLGLLRRTLKLPSVSEEWSRQSFSIALACTALWAFHPLATSSVAYLSRRTDLLVALFYLLTLYSALRGATQPRHRFAWYALAVASCFAGAASKETIASAPLIAFVFDRLFITGSFKKTWQERRALYLSLATSWILLAALLWHAQDRGGTIGWEDGISPLDYLMTQGHAILLYLRLSLWPDPLIFDYGTSLEPLGLALIAQGLLALSLTVATGVALWKWPRLGFVGLLFFALLAPSSSFVPVVTQPIAEHRMYLPLACIALLATLGASRLLKRWAMPCLAAVTLILAFTTAQRSETYASAEALWRDTIRHRPQNARGHNALGAILSYEGNFEGALQHFKEAVRLEPDNQSARANLASCLYELDLTAEALPHFQAALNAGGTPSSQTLYSYAMALGETGNRVESEAILRQIIKSHPEHFPARLALGNALIDQRKPEEAALHFSEAVKLNPDSESAATNFGNAQLLNRDIQGAIKSYRRSLEINANSPAAHTNLGIAYLLSGQQTLARTQFENALRLDPEYTLAQKQLARMNRR